jgi:hypothetical protein
MSERRRRWGMSSSDPSSENILEGCGRRFVRDTLAAMNSHVEVLSTLLRSSLLVLVARSSLPKRRYSGAKSP